MKRLIICSLIIACSFIVAWKGDEPKGEQPIFMGILESQEGNTFNVTNISIGFSRGAHTKISLYEMPKNISSKTSGDILTINPMEDLTTAQLELQKIKEITVPHPHRIYKWLNSNEKLNTSLTKEFIQVGITWRSGSTVEYLLELGLEKTTKPLKIFCDAIDKPLTGIRQDGTLFCPGLEKKDLRKKGAPFPSIKSLKLDEPCFKIPTEQNNGRSKNELD